jgi:hypothetical protein
MKKTVQQLLLVTGLLITQQFVFGQSAPASGSNAPKWTSDKGYWIVENNVHVPKKYVVYFYTNEGLLIHKQAIQGITLKLHKRKVKMQLKRTLETSVLAWRKSQESVVGSQ